MVQKQTTFGRMELAQAYFPCLQPRSAWHKFRALMQDYPETASILSARVASWHDAMGGALAGSRASTPAVQGFK